MTREEVLAEKGWKRQTTHDEPRLSNVVEMYEEMNFEVHLEPFSSDEESGCIECMKAMPDKYKTIYTKKKAID